MGDSAWLISKHLDLLLSQYSETAVSRYLEVCRSSPLTSGLLLPAVAKVCASNPQVRCCLMKMQTRLYEIVVGES